MDPRWTRSRDALTEAVSEYLNAGVTPSITDVVATARVSRPTFYQHFGDVPTAIAETALARIQSELDTIALPDEGADVDVDQVTATWLSLTSHLLDHHAFYRTALGVAGSRRLSDRVISFIGDRIVQVSPIGAQFRGADVTPDEISVLAAGLFWLISHWLEQDAPEPAPHMTSRIVAVLVTFTSRGATA